MALAYRTPAPSAADWHTHAEDLKRCRGAACYTAVARHFGTDSPKRLEQRIDRNAPYKNDGDESISNKYRRWRQGKALPSNRSIGFVSERSGNTVDLKYWRDLPLWELLAKEPPTIPRLHDILLSTPRTVRHILGINGAEPRQYGVSFAYPISDRLIELRDLRTLEAFLALLALARKAEVVEDHQGHYIAVASAFDIFTRVMIDNTQLFTAWPTLFTCIERVFWRRVYFSGICIDLPVTKAAADMEVLLCSSGAPLTQISAIGGGAEAISLRPPPRSGNENATNALRRAKTKP